MMMNDGTMLIIQVINLLLYGKYGYWLVYTHKVYHFICSSLAYIDRDWSVIETHPIHLVYSLGTPYTVLWMSRSYTDLLHLQQ